MEPRQLLLRIAKGIAYRRKLLVALIAVPCLAVFGAAAYYVVATKNAPRYSTTATLILEVDGREVLVDSRPSDAVALALRVKAPILATEALLNTQPSGTQP